MNRSKHVAVKWIAHFIYLLLGLGYPNERLVTLRFGALRVDEEANRLVVPPGMAFPSKYGHNPY